MELWKESRRDARKKDREKLAQQRPGRALTFSNARACRNVKLVKLSVNPFQISQSW